MQLGRGKEHASGVGGSRIPDQVITRVKDWRVVCILKPHKGVAQIAIERNVLNQKERFWFQQLWHDLKVSVSKARVTWPCVLDTGFGALVSC